MQRRGQRCTAVPDLRRSDQTKGGVGREPLRVVEVFVASEPAVNRLPKKIRQAELSVQPLSGVLQVLADQRLQSQAFIQLAHQNEARVGGDPRSLERDLQKAIERELKRLLL
jgi:hypothetical protein